MEEFQNEIKDYMQKHKIPKLFEKLTKDIIINRPENMIDFLIDKLEEVERDGGIKDEEEVKKKKGKKEELNDSGSAGLNSSSSGEVLVKFPVDGDIDEELVYSDPDDEFDPNKRIPTGLGKI